MTAAPFDFQHRTRVVFGKGSFGKAGELARQLGFRRTLLVADRGMVSAGYAGAVSTLLSHSGVECIPFHNFETNPDTSMVEAGRRFAAGLNIDSIVGLGGGSSMDCAKGINFLLTNGGKMQDYWGFGKASKPLLPMIGVPTTAGTGSEAQSYALISDADTHVKMACGDPKAAFRVAIPDPCLTASQPKEVRAATGYDAISHAVETFVTARRTAISDCYSREAWRLLESNYERVLANPGNEDALAAMQLGANFGGVAIENSMLGATHACANPLTAHFGITHGVAISVLLPHVVRWNAEPRYAELHTDLPTRLQELAVAGELPGRLESLGIPRGELDMLAQEAARQWTGTFNPRAFDAAGALEIYEWAY